ncbi:MAG: DegT/DnrJ/EryC1/StrS family aminotransferase [Candidatus Thorarchaeota archaeon]
MRSIPVSEPDLCGNEKKYVDDCLDSGWISSHGEYVGRFEQEFARKIGVKHAVSVMNGTAALHLVLLGLGVKPGDEIILPTLTFVSSANSVLFDGGVPVFVDSEEETWNMDVSLVEKGITEKTCGVMAVHLYGHPVDMDPLREICNKHGLYLIEDAAEAVGSKYKGRNVGTLADAAAFSFYGNKTITTGEGGMVTTDDDDLASRMRIIKNQGKSPGHPFWHEILGYNYRLTNVQAAIGLGQLENLDKFVKKKREIAGKYREYIDADGIIHSPEADYAFNSYWMSSIVIDGISVETRDNVMRSLADKGIDTRSFFYPMHALPFFHEYSRDKKFTIAERVSQAGINLPSSTKLSDDDIRYVSENVNKLMNDIRR